MTASDEHRDDDSGLRALTRQLFGAADDLTQPARRQTTSSRRKAVTPAHPRSPTRPTSSSMSAVCSTAPKPSTNSVSERPGSCSQSPPAPEADLVTRTARNLGVPLPDAFDHELDDGAQLVQAAEAIPRPNQLQAAVLDALAERPASTTPRKQIQDMFLDAALEGQLNIGGAARERANLTCQDALIEHADTILAGWADALEPHGHALLQAAAGLPTHNLDDTQAIINRGAEAMNHWAAAHEAIKMWRAATEGFMSLAMTARISATKRSPLIVTAADVTTLGEAEATAMREGRPVDVWMLARHQIPLRLATLGDYQARTASHEQQRQAAARHFEEQRERTRSSALT